MWGLLKGEGGWPSLQEALPQGWKQLTRHDLPAENSSFLAEARSRPACSDTCSFSLQSWDIFFRNTNAGAPPGTAYQSPLPLSPGALSAVARAQPLVAAQPNVDKLVEDHLAVQSLIRAYQVRRRHQPPGVFAPALQTLSRGLGTQEWKGRGKAPG